MNTLTKILTDQMKPVLLLTVYESSNTNDFYLESHEVAADGQVLAGRPLKQETISAIVDVFFDERKNQAKVTGMIPDNMIAFQLMPGGDYKMAWWRPEEKRIMHNAKQLKIPTGLYWVPPMLYVADRKSLNVYALGKNQRPKENTLMYYAPFFNVDDNGRVCLGNAKVAKPKNPTYSDLINYWESMFWHSEFSHVNGNQRVKSGNLSHVWKKMAVKTCRVKWLKSGELKQSKKTLIKVL